MTYLSVFILSLLEGVTEFLPISSTGHLIIFSQLMHLEVTDFLKLFTIVIQLGAIGAVVFYYHEKFMKVSLLKKLFVAFLPSGIVGFLFYKKIKELLGEGITVGVMLLLGGIVIILVEMWYGKHKYNNNIVRTHELSYMESFLLGLCQVFSLIPGTSR